MGSIRRLALAATCSAKLTRFAASHFATVAEVMNAVPVMTAPVALLSPSQTPARVSALFFSFFFSLSKKTKNSPSLDAKTGLVPRLVPGMQGSKSPGSLGPGQQTWDQAKFLKFILIDSIFLLSPCPDSNSYTRCFPGLLEEFFYSVEYLLSKHFPGIPRGKGDGGWKSPPYLTKLYHTCDRDWNTEERHERCEYSGCEVR